MSPISGQGGEGVNYHKKSSNESINYLPRGQWGRQAPCHDNPLEKDTDGSLNDLRRETIRGTGITKVVFRPGPESFIMQSAEGVVDVTENITRETEDGRTISGDEVRVDLEQLEEGGIYVFMRRGKKYALEMMPDGQIRYSRLIEE